jgi:hypothetical protein
MRTFIPRILTLIIGLTSAPLTLLAADTATGTSVAVQKIHHFSIIAPATAKV